MPSTTLIEWVWCAAQVGATYVEIGLFLTTLLLLCAICWHMYCWQKIMLTLHAVQAQLEENSKADSLVSALHDVKSSMMSMTGTADGDMAALKDIQAQLNALQSPEESIKNLMTELTVVKKHQLEIVSQLGMVKTMSAEVANFHKLLNTVVSDCGKLGGFYNRVTETHTLTLHLPTVQQQEAALEKLLKSVEESLTRVQKQLTDKLDDLAERTTILRVVMDQKHEKAVHHVQGLQRKHHH